MNMQESLVVSAKAEEEESFWRLGWALTLLLLPICNIAYLTVKHSVNIPFADDWDLVALIGHHCDGKLSLIELFGQHNEHRPAVLRAVTLLNVASSNWNLKYEMILSVALVVATLGVIAMKMVGHRRALRSVTVWLSLITSSVLLFSPTQFENFLWAFGGLQWFTHNLCVVVCITMLADRSRSWSLLFLSAACAVCATYSLASGLLLWPLVGAYLLVESFVTGRLRSRTTQMVVWGLLSACMIVVYFWNYRQPAHHPPLSLHDIAGRLLHFPGFIAAYLGNPLAFDNFPVAIAFGAVGVAMWVMLTWAVVRRMKRDSDFFYVAAPWVMLGMFSLASAMAASIGRGGWIPPTSSRYVSCAVYLWISVVTLAGHMWNRTISIIVALAVLTAALSAYPLVQDWRWACYAESCARNYQPLVSGNYRPKEAAILKKNRLSMFWTAH